MTSPSERPTRVGNACQRCRKQKLRCDLEKPCSACIKAAVDCVPRSIQRKSRTSNAKKLSDQASPGSSKNGFDGLVDDALLSTGTSEEAISKSVTSSWLGVAKILLNDDQINNSSRNEFALPWAPDVAIGPKLSDTLTIQHVFTGQLPSKGELDVLLDAYFDGSQWFMLIFHEPSFKQRYHFIFGNGVFERSEVNFVRLVLLLVGIGARFTALMPDTPVAKAVGLESLRKTLFGVVESSFVSILEVGDLCAVQICLLLGSYMTYDGRLSGGFSVVGSGVAVARSIGLSDEDGWTYVDAAEREERRRTWWALEIVDKFDAVKSGRSTGIQDTQVNVSLPEDLDDQSSSGGLPSLLAYHHSKFMLYRILSPVLLDRRVTLSQRVMKSIVDRIQQWESKLPPHLQWGAYEELDTGNAREEDQKHARLLRLQALALHTSFSSLKIILHRPFVFTPAAAAESLAKVAQMRASRQAIYETALRISNIATRYPRASTEVASCTHAATLCGIAMFTAGVILGYIALSSQSPDTEQALNGISRIISMQTNNGSRHVLVSSQGARVLEDLTQLIQLRLGNPNQHQFQGMASDMGPTSSKVANLHVANTAQPDAQNRVQDFNHPMMFDSSLELTSMNDLQEESKNGSLLDWPMHDQAYDSLNDVRQVLIDNSMNESLSFIFGDFVPP